METKEEGAKLQIAIRCARAANLLSSLRNRGQLEAQFNKEDVEKEMMKREIDDLKVELVRERMKSKKIQLSVLMEAILQVAMVLFVSGLLSIIALKFLQN